MRTNHKLLTISFFLSAVLTAASAQAQRPNAPANSSNRILLNQPFEREIKGGAGDAFRFEVKAGFYARFEVEEKSDFETKVSLFAPNGKLITEADGKDDDFRRKTVSFIAKTSGIYQIKIEAYGTSELSGIYSIILAENRLVAPDDDKRLEAERSLSEGRKLFLQLKNQDAIRKYQLAASLWDELGDTEKSALAFFNLGQAYSTAAKIDLAAKAYTRSFESFQTTKNYAGMSKALNALGYAYFNLSRYNEALKSYEKSLGFAGQSDDKNVEADALNGFGNVYDKLAQYEKAKNFYERALSVNKEIQISKSKADTFYGLGNIADKHSQFEAASKYYEYSLTISRKIEYQRGAGAALIGLGTIYDKLARHERARDYYEQALSINRKINNQRNVGYALNGLGNVYAKLKRLEKARDYYEQALVVRREIKERRGEGSVLNNLGNTYKDLKQYEKAAFYYEQALAVRREIIDRRGEASVLNNLGYVFYILGQSEKAKDYYEQSLNINREIGNRSGEGAVDLNLLLLFEQSKNPQFAIFYGKQAVNIYQEIRANIKNLDKDSQRSFLAENVFAYRRLSDILIAEGRLPEAQAVLDLLKDEEFSGLTSRSSGNAPENVPYSQAEDAAVKIVNQIARLGREKSELAEKNQKETLNENERSRFLELDTQISSAEDEFNKSLARLSKESGKNQSIKTVEAEAQAFMETLGQLGKGTVALYTVLVNDAKPLASGQSKTAADEKVKTGWIILVTPEFRKAYPIDVTNLEQTVFAFRTALSSPRYDPKPLAEMMYKKLFLQTSEKQTTTIAADLDEYFKTKPDKTLMWSLDGILRYVPMAALHDGKTYLVEKYRNTLFNTASKDRLKETVNPKWTVFGLGVSQERNESGKKFPALAGAKRELETIIKQNNAPSGILGGIIKLDEQFTRDAMFQGLLFNKNPVVHIASHFSYQPADFNESFLLIGNGKLTASQLSAKSTLFSNVDLLTLSACETAVGGANGKDLEGFAYLAQSLGAKAVMATLWQVDDIGTQVLMPEFYRLHEANLDKAEALRQAQLALLRGTIKEVPADLKRSDLASKQEDKFNLPVYRSDPDKPFAHPYYWSPFVLIGNWR